MDRLLLPGYYRRVLRRATSDWWDDRGKQILMDVCGIIVGALWGGLLEGGGLGRTVLAGLLGGLSAALLGFLWKLVMAPALIDAEQTLRIGKLGGARMAASADDRMLEDRVALYRLAFEAINRFIMLRNACWRSDEPQMFAAEDSFTEWIERLNTRILEADIREATKYSEIVAQIRTVLDGPGHIFNKSNDLREPVLDLGEVCEEDRRWDLRRAGLPFEATPPEDPQSPRTDS